MTKSKKNKVTQIYPREEFEQKYKAFEEDSTLENYLDLLIESQNSSELNRVNEIKLKDTVDFFRIDHANEGLDRLREIWDTLSLYSSKFKHLGWPKIEEKKASPVKSSDKIASSNLSELANKYGELLRQHLNEQSRVQESVRSLGINYLPTQATYGFLENIPALKKDLGFDVFGELEEYLASVDKSLPHSIKQSTKLVKDRSLILETIAKQWHYLMNLFWDEWKKSLPEIQEQIFNENDEKKHQALRTLGKYIYRSNLFSGFLIIYGVDHGDLDRFIDEKFKQEITEDPDSQEDDLSLEDSINSEINKLKSYGLNESTSKMLAVYYCYLVMYSIDLSKDESLYEKLDKVLHFSSLLTPNIRTELTSYIGNCQELFTPIDSSGIFHAAFAYRSEIKFKNLTEPDGIRKIEDLFDSLNLHQQPLADDDFISASDALIFSSEDESASWGWRGHWKSEDLFYASQQIFNSNLFNPIYDYSTIPSKIKSLHSLRHFAFLNYIPNEPKLTCPIWALAKVSDDDYSMFYLQSRTDMHLNAIDCMLEHGLISGASHLFFFYLVTESVITISRIKERKESSDIRPNSPSLQGFTAPFGDWNRINTIFLKISQYGFKDKSERVAGFISSIFADSTYDELLLAKIEIDRFSRSQIDKPKLDSSAQVIQLVTGDNSSLRSRIVELLGKDNWDILSIELQSKILMLERNHDVMNGDEVIYGQNNSAWFPPYVTLMESILKRKIGKLWDDPLYDKAISESYMDVTQKPLPNNKFTLGIALQVIKGAVKNGNKSILEFCKGNNVDIFRISSEIADPLLKGPIRQRNNVVHGSEVIKSDLEAARMSLLKSLPLFLMALGDQRKNI